VQPGHPFDTAYLDELRARQRRWLRAVPDWLVTRDELPKLMIPVPDRAMIEVVLRRQIDARRELFEDWLEEEANSTAASVMLVALGTIPPVGPSSPFGQHLDEVFAAADEATTRRTRRIDDPDLESALYRMVLLAGWADLLAGGWQDGRLRWVERI
jgi:hypothetical protein